MAQEYKQRAVIKDLQEKGYEVRTVPGFENLISGGNRLNAQNYTNVVLSENKALVPAYGVRAVDEAAFKVYRDLGYEVIPMRSTRYTLCMEGGIRCTSETYRTHLGR